MVKFNANLSHFFDDIQPVFKDCGTYYPKVEEGAPNGSPVIKVQAIDEDKGVNGQVRIIIFLLFPFVRRRMTFLEQNFWH